MFPKSSYLRLQHANVIGKATPLQPRPAWRRRRNLMGMPRGPWRQTTDTCTTSRHCRTACRRAAGLAGCLRCGSAEQVSRRPLIWLRGFASELSRWLAATCRRKGAAAGQRPPLPLPLSQVPALLHSLCPTDLHQPCSVACYCSHGFRQLLHDNEAHNMAVAAAALQHRSGTERRHEQQASATAAMLARRARHRLMHKIRNSCKLCSPQQGLPLDHHQACCSCSCCWLGTGWMPGPPG